MVEMPILEMTLTTPLTAALTNSCRHFEVDIGEQAFTDHVVDGFEGEVGIDGGAAVTDEEGKVVNLARFSGFEDEADAGARAFADEVMVEAGDGEEGWDGGMSRSMPRSERMRMLTPWRRPRSAAARGWRGPVRGLGALVPAEEDGECGGLEAGEARCLRRASSRW
jgi:hypothetical protein